MAGNISADEEEAAKAIEDPFTAVVNGDTAAAEALEDMHRRTVGHRPLDDNVMSRFAEFKKEQRERWKYKFVYDDPKIPGTDESVVDWMLTQDNIPDDIEEMYPGIRAVQALQGKHKLHPLPAEASEGEPGFDDYMAACTIRFVGCLTACHVRSALAPSRVCPLSLACVCCCYNTANTSNTHTNPHKHTQTHHKP